MQQANRELLLKWGKKEQKAIELTDGLTLGVRQLDVSDLLEIRDESKPIGKTVIGVAYLIRSAVNEDGTPMFTEADIPILEKEFAYGRIGDIYNKLKEFNGETEKAQADFTKN